MTFRCGRFFREIRRNHTRPVVFVVVESSGDSHSSSDTTCGLRAVTIRGLHTSADDRPSNYSRSWKSSLVPLGEKGPPLAGFATSMQIRVGDQCRARALFLGPSSFENYVVRAVTFHLSRLPTR